MRIAYVTDDLYPGFGGQAKATERHIAALAELGHDLRVIAGKERKPTQPPEGVELTRLATLNLPAFQMHFAVPELRALQRLLNWAEVVHINNPALLGLVSIRLARTRNIPIVLGLHVQEETLSMHFQGAFKALARQLMKNWFRFYFSQGDYLVAPTDFAARLGADYTKKPCVTVSNGLLKQSVPRPDDEAIRKVRNSYLPDEGFLLCYINRLASEKRPGDMLAIMEHLVKYRQDVKLVIAGKGPMQEELKRSSQEKSLDAYVEFAGFISEQEKFRLLAASDLFFMPSPTELQSIATLEALSQRTAVFAVRAHSSAVTELVETSDCGLIYPADNPQEASFLLHNLLANQERLDYYKAQAQATARQHDTHKSAQKLAELYKVLVHQAQGNKL